MIKNNTPYLTKNISNVLKPCFFVLKMAKANIKHSVEGMAEELFIPSLF